MRKPHRRLSDATEQAVELLHRSASLRGIFSGSGEKLRVIEEIANSGEPEAIPDLLPLVVTGRKEIAHASARAITTLLHVLQPIEFVQLDQYVRQGNVDWRERRKSWYELTARDVRYLTSLEEEAASLLGMASCHMNGYVRQAAVEELGKIRSGAELPFLLLRVNDWVAGVRNLSLKFLRQRMRAEYIRHFVQWLPLAARLRELRRWNQADLIEAIDDLLEGPGAVPFLIEGATSPDRDVRRFCYRHLLKQQTDQDRDVMRTALADGDWFVRLQALRAFGKRVPNADEQYLGLLQACTADPFARIRMEALRIYVEAYPDRAGDYLDRSLLDANGTVREAAQFYYEKWRTANLREFYLEKISSSRGEKLAVAIAGLGEKGKASDAVTIACYLDDGSPSVRAAALRALLKLDASKFVESFLGALCDPSRRVAREGIAGLRKRTNAVGAARLWSAFVQCSSARGKCGVLFLIALLSRWDGLPYLLQALGEPDREVASAAERYLQRLWLRWNRSFMAPSEQQAAMLRKVLTTHGLLISDEKSRWLKNVLGM